jgi:hypothetical protein
LQTSVDVFLKTIYYIKNMDKNSYFADIKEMFTEAAQRMLENERRMQENERILNEKFAETDRRMQETDRRMQETDRMIKKLNGDVDKLCAQVGGIDENQGHHAEQYFQDILAGKLTFGGQKYDTMIPNLECFGKGGVSLIEFDIVLVNGKSVAIIETKNRIHPKFVRQFVEERLPKFREYFPGFSKYKAYLGIAGFSFSKKVMEEARKYGIGVIRQAGDSVEITAERLKVYV